MGYLDIVIILIMCDDMVIFTYLELDNIVISEGLRKVPLEEQSLKELADSIAKHGVLQPILVEPIEEEGRYRLLIGERRTRAARMAGLETIPTQILEELIRPDEALEKKLVENLHREDLDPLDEAEAYLVLKEMGLKVSEIARRVGKSRPYISKRMRLIKLHPKVREAVRRRTVTTSQGQYLLRLTPEQQLSLLKEIQTRKMTEKETRKRVRNIIGKPLKWHLVPMRFNLEVYEKLKSMAPEGNVKELIKQTVQKLVNA
jgi:ParB family chromosome partitioning protein